MPDPHAMPAAFLDRDGVINADHGYVANWKDFEFLPGAEDAMRGLQSLGFCLVIVTNQSGIGRGYYTETDVDKLHQKLIAHCAAMGVEIAGIYYCPHHPSEAKGDYLQLCECRKPAPGMLLTASRELNIDLDGSIMVGDKPSDMEAAQRAGVGKRFQVTQGSVDADVIAVASLLEVVDCLRG